MGVEISPAISTVLTTLWIAGITATLVGAIAVFSRMSFVEHSAFFTVILIVATLGTAVSGVGVLKMVGVPVPQLPLFADDSTILHFVAYANIIFYAVLFLWAANAGISDAAVRLKAFAERKRPLNRAAAAEAEGDLKKAAHIYLSYLGDHRQDMDTMRLYGICLVKLGRFNDAIEVFRRIMASAHGVRSLSAGVEIAHIFEARLGDAKSAEKEIKNLREAYIGTPFEAELETRIRLSRTRDAAC